MLVPKRLVILEPHQYEPHLPILGLSGMLSVGTEIRSYQETGKK
jgi:hypothetical protein